MGRYTEEERVFRAFCEERRLQILGILREGERCACVLLEDLQISQPTLSHHMRILCDSGIVNSRRDGKKILYSISEAGSRRAEELLVELTTPVSILECCACNCE